MIRKTLRVHNLAKFPLAAAIAATVSSPVSAFQFYMGDVEASFDTTLSAGASWRLSDRDTRQLAQGNLGPEYGYTTTGASTNNYDDGNWNFDKGDSYSQLIKGNSELLVSYDNYGGFIRAKYWYDFKLKDGDLATDGVGQTRPLNKVADANASGASLLDAYVWGDFDIGDMPLSLRLGKQVVSWGEGLFIQGGNSVINPIDVSAIRAPGAELKEAFIPVNMLYTSLGVSENVSLEGFVQLEWEKTLPDDCGTFYSMNDFGADGCGPVLLAGQIPDSQAYAQGIAAYRFADHEPDDTDQFGVAVRWYVPELNDSELGFYFIQYHNRLPMVSGQVNNFLTGQNFPKYNIVYPEKVQNFGVSFNTSTESGWSVAGEVTHKLDVPVQWNAFELIYGGLSSNASLLYDREVAKAGGDPTALFGEQLDGFDRFDISQIQFTLIKFFDQVAGASRLTFVSEFGATYIHDLPGLDEARYGRAGTFGIGPIDASTLIGNPVSCDGSIPGTGPANINIANCVNEGYTTDFSWGYRMRFALDYNDVVAGVNFRPTLAWSHDVRGYSAEPGPNFIEGRKAIGLSLKATYLNAYSGTIGYTNYFGGGRFNMINDRDNISASVSYSF
ncbi:MAG: peptide ABC transporter substrate-binding protein [Gammaproteobacteria bacterium]|nr:MAG: peptide ABC transporter substrate-binding protein [Pseudomonadota bacterium]PIE38215.1 MAG: peptide ABC transporter substrate-binding protein [Gammaproteobacteria bacterium]